MLTSDLLSEANNNRAKRRLAEARERYVRCRSICLRSGRGKKLQAQGALQAACRELLQAEMVLEQFDETL